MCEKPNSTSRYQALLVGSDSFLLLHSSCRIHLNQAKIIPESVRIVSIAPSSRLSRLPPYPNPSASMPGTPAFPVPPPDDLIEGSVNENGSLNVIGNVNGIGSRDVTGGLDPSGPDKSFLVFENW